MKALRTFLIASAVALVMVPQVAPGWIRGAAIASLISLVSGNVAVYVNPSSSGSTPCGLNGGSTCQAGSDSNTCLTISAPCKTFQNAAYILNQTLLWGFNIGTAQIFLGNGTYPETVYLTATIGVPKKCSSTACSPSIFTQLNGIEIIGNDSSPSSVVISPSNGTCNNGAWGMPGSVLNFLSGTYLIHGFTVNASSEATYECSVISTWQGVHLGLAGTMNLGPAAGSGYIFNLQGGGLVTANYTINLTIGSSVTGAVISVFNDGQFYDDQGTVNFIDSGTIPGGYGHGVIAGDSSGVIGFATFDTITGGIASGACYYLDGSNVETSTQTGVLKQQLVPGCSVANSYAYIGVNFQGTSTATALSTHLAYNNSAPTPTVTGCGSGAALINPADVTDTSGTITVGSGATGCTLNFVSSYLKVPDCMVTGGLAVTLVGSNPYTGFSVTSGSISSTNLVYHCLFHL